MERNDRQRTQKAKVIAWLKETGTITPLEALRLFGCFRLASVINRLRNEGYKILTENMEEKGVNYAKYRLIK